MTASVGGIDLDVAGLILMIVGAVGLVLSLFWMTLYSDRTRDRAVVRERDVVERDVR